MLHATQLTSKTLDMEACELPWLAVTRMGHHMPLSELSIVHKTGHHELSPLSSEPLPCVLSLADLHLHPLTVIGASLVPQMLKNLPVMQETRVQSLGQEYPPEKGKATAMKLKDAYSLEGKL